jgi:hypothetical protein
LPVERCITHSVSSGFVEIIDRLYQKINITIQNSLSGLNFGEHLSLIRQYLPKKQDVKNVMDKKIREIQNLLNNRPRKVLNFLTPFEIFFQLTFSTVDCGFDACHS